MNMQLALITTFIALLGDGRSVRTVALPETGTRAMRRKLHSVGQLLRVEGERETVDS
jgi:hypothetical protein